jgi:Zn-dependent protease
VNPEQLIPQLVIYMAVLLFAISAHEAAHAWMSDKFGDDTARLLGRVTLNPIAHTDPIGTLLIPIAGFVLGHMGGVAAAIPLIGLGKPTPVNPFRWRNKNIANIMVSIAGILANLTIGLFALLLIKIVQHTNLFAPGTSLSGIFEPVWMFLTQALLLNVSLAVFNLLPFPPLDGSKVLWTILPDSMKPVLEALERFGFIILLIAMQAGLLDLIFTPVRWVLLILLSL